MDDRQKALSKFTYLKKELYDLGVKAQALVNTIHEETDTFLSENDFTTIDFKKIETLSVELQNIQKDFKEKAETFNKIKNTFKFSEH